MQWYRILIVVGMIAVGIVVWRVLQRQESRRGDGNGKESDRGER